MQIALSTISCCNSTFLKRSLVRAKIMSKGENQRHKCFVLAFFFGICTWIEITMSHQFWVVTTVKNHFDYSYSLQSAFFFFSVPFILFSKSKLRRQPRDTKAAKMRIEKAKTLSQAFSKRPWMLMSPAERIWRGFPAGQQSALNGPAVLCSFWCPSALWAAKKEGQTEPRHNARRDKSCFYKGFYLEVIKRPRDNWGEHMLRQGPRFTSCFFFLIRMSSSSIQPDDWPSLTRHSQFVGGLGAPGELLMRPEVPSPAGDSVTVTWTCQDQGATYRASQVL